MKTTNILTCKPEKEVSQQAKRWSLLFIGVLLTGGLVLEAGTRLLIPRMSRIEARVVREYHSAILPSLPGKPTVLFLGNSLMNAAVDFDHLKHGVGSEVETRRFVLEGTGYWDWFYGIRRLFADGARSDVVVLMLGRHDLMSRAIRGDYFANRLMRTGDLLMVTSDLKLHPTVVANMLAANLSTFYGLRSEIRKVLIGKLMPDVPIFVHNLTAVRGETIMPDEMANVGGERLRTLNSLVKGYHARFIFILVPEPLSEANEVEPLRKVAAQLGIPLVLTFHDGKMLPSDYSDGFHMNTKGAEKYTHSLIPEIKQLIEKDRDVVFHLNISQ